MKPNEGVMNVKNGHSWVQKFKEGQGSCDNKPKQPQPWTSRTGHDYSCWTSCYGRLSLRCTWYCLYCMTVTANLYKNVLRTKFLPVLYKKQTSKAWQMHFHQDNTPAHRALVTQQFLQNNIFEVVSHAPYSPDLAPSNTWLFSTMKDTLHAHSFPNQATIATAIFQWAKHTPKEEFSAAMELTLWKTCSTSWWLCREVTVVTTFCEKKN